METARDNRRFNWQQKGWPAATVDRTALRGELAAFKKAFRAVKKRLKKPQPAEAVAHVLVQEAVKTSAIEGVLVDESVVLSSICKALGVASDPVGFTKDPRAEGVAQMMLAVREDWDKPLTAALLKRWHKKLLAGEEERVAVGAFRSHKEPMRVIRRLADGTVEIRFEAPPSARVPQEIRAFLAKWRRMTKVSKSTATRDLAELAATGAVVAEGVNTKTHYVLACVLHEPQIFKNAKMREYGKTEKVDLNQQNQGSREKQADFGHEPQTENEPLNEGINEPINETVEERVMRLVTLHPGRGVPFLKATTQTSRETVKRALAALVAAGKVEHRGSKKTGGYFAKDDSL